MIPKHKIIMGHLCAPHSFLLRERKSNGAYKVTLYLGYERTKLTLAKDTLINWLAEGLIVRSEHIANSYHITQAGREFAARFEEPDVPLKMESILAAQRLVRAAIREAAR